MLGVMIRILWCSLPILKKPSQLTNKSLREQQLMSHEHPSLAKKGLFPWLTSWVFTTNHKDIGTLYLFLSLAMLFVGGSFALIIRAKLFQPGMNFITPGFYNQLVTTH